MHPGNCKCAQFMYGYDRPIVVHLSGCTDSKEVREYRKLPWYRRIFKHNPSSLYDYDKCSTSTLRF